MTSLLENYPWYAFAKKKMDMMMKEIAIIRKKHYEKVCRCHRITKSGYENARKIEFLNAKLDHDLKMNAIRSSRKMYLYLQNNFHKIYSLDAKVQKFISFMMRKRDDLLCQLDDVINAHDDVYTNKDKNYMHMTKKTLENYGKFKDCDIENYGVTIKLHINRLCCHDVANMIYSYL